MRTSGSLASPFALLLALLLTMAPPATAQLVNPANGHTYLTTPFDMPLAESRAYAAGLCGYLVAINDAAEQAWIIANFPAGTYWIGASDEFSEGTFLWDSGEPFLFTSWCLGEPNNFFLEDYAILQTDCGLGTPGWNDIWPLSLVSGLIEIPAPAPPVGPGQANSAAATLTVNGFGCGTTGTQTVLVDTFSPPIMELIWRGPANMTFALMTGTANPANGFYGCIGWAEIGTPPAYGDVIFILDGLASPLFTLDAQGTAKQTFSIPGGLPSGALFTIQGLVVQPIGCPLVLTAAFNLAVT